MMQRRVRAPDILGGQPCGHRLHALALARQQQSGAIRLQRSMAIGVFHGFRQAFNMCRKTLLLWAWRG